ncbi:MAG: M48 family metallopeptidase [Bacteroidota bacterium]
MKIHTFLLCLFTTLSALSLFAQYPKDYEPVPIYSDFPSYIAEHMSTQLSEDLEGIQARGKVKRSLKEVYQARHDQLLENVQNGYYIFDDFLFGYCDAIFSHILDANPQIPRDKVHLILDRSTVPNASCWGEGSIVLNTGLLARVDNEAQIAFVLCHELAHHMQDHVNEEIRRSVKAIYDEEIEEIYSTTEGGFHSKESLEFVRKSLFDKKRHARLKEFEADSIGLAYYLNTDYAPVEALGLLRILDEIDDEKYPSQNDLVQFLDNIGFTYREEWVRYLPDTTFYYQKPAKEWTDSLKTHPDCAKRIERLANLLVSQNVGSGGVTTRSTQVALEELQETLDFELLYSHYYLGNYGLLIHEGLKLLKVYPESDFVKGILALSFQELAERKADHRLSTVLATVNPREGKPYDQTLHFLYSLRLKYLRRLSQFVVNHWENSLDENEFLLLAGILAAHDQEDFVNRDARLDAYFMKYPEGRFRDVLTSRFPR